MADMGKYDEAMKLHEMYKSGIMDLPVANRECEYISEDNPNHKPKLKGRGLLAGC